MPYFDIHCHIIPGVDDGSDNLKTSLAMLEEEYAAGVRSIILTPHYRPGMFEASKELILDRYEALREQAAAKLPDLKLYLGSEFHAHKDQLEALEEGDYTMAGSKYLLLEFSGRHTRDFIIQKTKEVLSLGLKPIIAHVERYEICVKDSSLIPELKAMGAYIQVNADAVLGYEGFSTKRFTKKLLKQALVDYVGSDAHGVEYRNSNIGKCISYIEKKFGKEVVDRIFSKNPGQIVG